MTPHRTIWTRNGTKRIDLTEREVIILRLLAKGEPSKKIAQRIKRTEGTTRVIEHELFKKLGVRNRTQAAVLAVRNGIE